MSLSQRSQLREKSIPSVVSNQTTGLTGTVKWFNNTKGYGFISRDDGAGPDLFVRWNHIIGSGYRSLTVDKKVTFDIGRYEGRDVATNVKQH